MKITIIDSQTGKEIQSEIPEPKPGFFEFIRDTNLSDDEIRSRIDQMNISADVKSLLYSFSKTTIRAGQAIIKLGRKVIDIIFALMKAFPNITFGIIFGLVVGMLIAAIPLLGLLLGALVTKLAVLFGIVLGAKAELESGDLGKRVEALITEFAPLHS